MKFEITKPQLRAIIDIADTISSMIGTADDDSEFKRILKNLDALLKKNGYSRKYK